MSRPYRSQGTSASTSIAVSGPTLVELRARQDQLSGVVGFKMPMIAVIQWLLQHAPQDPSSALGIVDNAPPAPVPALSAAAPTVSPSEVKFADGTVDTGLRDRRPVPSCFKCAAFMIDRGAAHFTPYQPGAPRVACQRCLGAAK